MVSDARVPLQYHLGMNRLRKYREMVKPHLSGHKLAAKLGTQQPQVNRWERWGEPGAPPSARQIPIWWAIRAAKILGCRPIDLRPDLQNLRSLDLMIEGSPEDVQDRIWGLVRQELEKS